MAVREVRSGDLKIDLPTPPGEAWRVTQANAPTPSNSHRGPFTYCYDMVSEGGTTAGAKFVSTADARIAAVNDQHGADGCILKEEGDKKNVNDCRSNYVSQKLGRGRYASSLHLRRNSYVSTFGQGKADALSKVSPQSSWNDRPVAKSGEAIGLVGDSGTGAGNDHIHFCVTTAPDDPAYGPFESTPFMFRNYEQRVATGFGDKWVKWVEGRPKAGDVIRRPAGYSGGAAAVKHLAGTDVVHGETVRGAVALSSLNAPLAPGVVTLRAYSPWGEPTSIEAKIKVDGSLGANPLSFALKDVPNYVNTTVRARYEPTAPAPRWARPLDAVSAPFTPNDSPANLVNISLQPGAP